MKKKIDFIKYITQFAGRCNFAACFNLSDMLLNRIYVTKDDALGMYYLEIAAICGHPNVINMISNFKIL